MLLMELRCITLLHKKTAYKIVSRFLIYLSTLPTEPNPAYRRSSHSDERQGSYS